VTAMMSGVVVVAAFGLLAVLGLVLVIALFRVTARPISGGDRTHTGPKGS
jgi:hypothetical protein